MISSVEVWSVPSSETSTRHTRHQLYFLPEIPLCRTCRRIGPEISFGTVPKFPQKVGTKHLCLLKGHFPLLMLCIDCLQHADRCFELTLDQQVLSRQIFEFFRLRTSRQTKKRYIQKNHKHCQQYLFHTFSSFYC